LLVPAPERYPSKQALLDNLEGHCRFREIFIMEVLMKKYTMAEREEHLREWEKGTLSRTEYAKSAGIKVTTFYKWAQGADDKTSGFVEIDQKKIPDRSQSIVVERGGFTIHIPVSISIPELQKIFTALGATI
jgi:Rps23 Pro-64 3,4-dihydroxylase Tpa1-like proline 4-hydroxylase